MTSKSESVRCTCLLSYASGRGTLTELERCFFSCGRPAINSARSFLSSSSSCQCATGHHCPLYFGLFFLNSGHGNLRPGPKDRIRLSISIAPFARVSSIASSVVLRSLLRAVQWGSSCGWTPDTMLNSSRLCAAGNSVSTLIGTFQYSQYRNVLSSDRAGQRMNRLNPKDVPYSLTR